MVQKILWKMIEYFGSDVKRINHAIKVRSFSSLISSGENLSTAEQTIIEYAAILHDIGIREAERKHNSSAGNFQELEGPPVAQRILAENGVPPPIVDRVCFIIGHHHTYTAIDGKDFQVLVEADFIVNIFEDALPPDSINRIKKRIFKTSAGIELLDSMYLK